MSKVFVTSDWHLGHRGIHEKFRLEFDSVEHHDSTIIDNYRKVVTKRDVVYFLGDIIIDPLAVDVIKELPAKKKILVVGNHDTENVHMAELVTAFDEVVSLLSRKGAWLSHAPIHPEELRGKVNIHGHVHTETLQDPRYFNVSMENTDYTPLDLQDIRRFISENIKEGSVRHRS